MIRIKIRWNFTSPLLRIASGILKVEDIILGNGKSDKLLIKCKVKKEPGTLGYSAIRPDKGIPSQLFEELRPIIDRMVNSYYRGMILETSDFEWINDSADMKFEEWAEKKGIPKKITYE